MQLRGCFQILFLYDVAEAFDPERLKQLLGPSAGAVNPSFARRTPEYVRFSEPPILEPVEAVVLETGEQFACSVKYYAFGVAVVRLDTPFDCDWDVLLAQTSRWMGAPDVEQQARAVVQHHMERITPAVIRPNNDWLHESYLVVRVHEVCQSGSERPSAAQLVSTSGDKIAQLLRGETVPLAREETEELLKSRLSYFPQDLIVVASAAALIYDRPEDAAAVAQILEYARLQLLEFRYYDGLMSQFLSDVYSMLERKRNLVFSRWTLSREADRVNRLLLDVMDLTERMDNALKFVSDAYYARVHRMAAKRMGVEEYRDLVEEKLHTVGELYDFMVTQFNEARSFIIEVIVGILVLIDVIFLFHK
jgi:hypothetical protein